MKVYILAFLSVGMTLVGAHSSFFTYYNSYGLLSAVIATIVFEILRLTILYGVFYFENKFRAISIPLYTGLASICFITATIGFMAKTDQQMDRQLANYNKELIKRAGIVQKACVEKHEPKITYVKSKIETINQRLSKYPSDKFWLNRLNQRTKELEQIITERDSIISSMNLPDDNLEPRINKYAVVYGVTLEPLNKATSGSTYIARAIKELTNLEITTSKKLLAIVICLGVEGSIIVLAFFSSYFAKKYPKPKKFKKEKDLKEKIKNNKVHNKLINKLNGNGKVLYALKENFDDGRIQKFIDKYQENDRIPPAKELSRNLREVRKFVLDNFSKEDLDKFFGMNEN
jgi:hypothetical protein